MPTALELGRTWRKEIEAAEKRDKRWVERGRKIIKRYRDERADQAAPNRKKFNILWSNVQTLYPAVYAKAPLPVCERRFLDNDPIARVASTIWERSLRYEIEDNGFHEAMRRLVLDFLLPGRGQAWVRYEPTFGEPASPEQVGESPYDDPTDEGSPNPGYGGTVPGGMEGAYSAGPDAGTGAPGAPLDPDGAQEATLLYERTGVDYVNWEDFLTSDGRTFEEVTWVGRRLYMGRAQLVEKWGKDKGRKIPLESVKSNDQRQARDGEKITKATIYEIWCKESKKVFFFAKGYDECIEELDDPLHLQGFWPCPKPLLATTTNDTLTPVPDFAEYQDQADQIDELTQRISMLTSALKVAGVYDSSAKQMARLLDEGMENKLVAVDNWAAFSEKGGVAGAIMFLPIKDIAEVLLGLYEAREKLKQDLYEITGISDIIRGQGEASETATAQQIKGSYASQRLGHRQGEVARFARDLIAIVGEVVAEQFSTETLIQISSIMQNDGVTAMQQMQEMQAGPEPVDESGGAGMSMPGGPPVAEPGSVPPPMAAGGAVPSAPGAAPIDPEMAKTQRVMEAIALLRNEKLRGFRIDLETDSTIALDAQQEKESRVEFITAIGGFLEKAVLAGQAFPIMIPLLGKMMKFTVRGFRVGRDLESAFDEFDEASQQMVPQLMQPQEDPAAAAEQAKAQADMAIQQQKAQADMASKAADAQLAERKAQLDAQTKQMQVQAQIELEQQKAAVQLELMRQEAAIKRQIMLDDAQARREQYAMDREARSDERVMKREEHERKVNEPPKAAISVKHEAKDVAAPLVEAIGKGQKQTEDSQKQMQAVLAELTTAVKAMSRPRKIVRGKDGRAMGVE